MIRHARMLGRPDALPARPRPRLDRRAVRPRPDHRGGGRDPPVARPRAVPRADVAVHQRDTRGHAGPAAAGRRIVRLVASRVSRWTRSRAGRSARPSSGFIAMASLIVLRPSSTGAPGCRTSVSDLEVIPTPETGTLWTIRYHLIDEATGQPDPDATIAVATTRPETILGDTAVAVHPDDPRYRDLVGRRVRIPFVERDVPVIADEAVEREFGTGALKITPAHDNDDYAIGRRHDLPMITVLDDAAAIAGTGTPYDGLDRYAARERILADLEARGDLVGARPHEMLIGRCQRSNDVIEPRLKTQWFIKTAPLAERALAATRSGRTRILPERFVKVWEHWMTNIRDWNVSRQLWWGHRIPAWYCPDGHVDCVGSRGRSVGLRRLRAAGVRARTGPRHLRYLVQLRAVAVLDTWLAGRHARLPALLPDVGDGDRARHPVLLGRPDDDAGAPPDGSGAVPHGLPVRADPRCRGAADVEDEGQRRRPAGGDGGVGRRRAPVRADPRRDTRAGPAIRAAEARKRPQLRQQALECDPLRDRRQAGLDRCRCRTRAAGPFTPGPGRAVDPLAGGGDDGRGRPGDGRLRLRRGDPRALRRHLVGVLRLGTRAGEGPARRRDAAGRGPGGDLVDARRGPRHLSAPAPSGHALRDRAALGGAAAPSVATRSC